MCIRDRESGVVSRNGFSIVDDSRSMAVTEDGWVDLRPEGSIDLYFFGYGHRYQEAVKDLYYLCGRTPLLPRWVFGNWWSRYHRYTEQELSLIHISSVQCKGCDRRLRIHQCLGRIQRADPQLFPPAALPLFVPVFPSLQNSLRFFLQGSQCHTAGGKMQPPHPLHSRLKGHLCSLLHAEQAVPRGQMRKGKAGCGPVSYTHLDVYKRQA